MRSKVVTALSWWLTCPSGDQKEVLELSWTSLLLSALLGLLPHPWRLYLTGSQVGTALVAQPVPEHKNQKNK